MEIDEMLKCFSLFYLRPIREDWALLERQDTWLRFTGTIRYLLAGRTPSAQFLACSPLGTGAGAAGAGAGAAGGQTAVEEPLSRWLFGETGIHFAESELAQAPTFEEHQHFTVRHYVGGLPVSVLPIESLYRCWTLQESATLSFAHQTGLYGGDPAAHMAKLLERFELTLASYTMLPPDHLAIELDFLALLVRYGNAADIHHFIDDHLSWLPSYVDTLLERVPEARIYLAITVLLTACLETLRLHAQERSQKIECSNGLSCDPLRDLSHGLSHDLSHDLSCDPLRDLSHNLSCELLHDKP
jgi:hypothetical protein